MRFKLLFGIAFALAFFWPSRAEAQVPAPPVPVEAEDYDFAGAYDCSGTGVEGKRYALTLVVAREFDSLRFIWLDGRKLAFEAVGVQTGNVLSLSAMKVKEEEGALVYTPIGVGAYAVGPETLKGKWASGDGRVYTENCLRYKPHAAK